MTTRTIAIALAAGVVISALLGAFFVLVRGSANTSLALGYYIVGSLIIIAGGFPSGGLSVFRGKMTTRRPTGAGGYAIPSIVLGLAIIGVGFLLDYYKPF